jgi:hypothetical protein
VLRPFWRSEGTPLVVLTNRGLIFGDTADPPFRLMCTEALSISNTERPDLALLPHGRLMIASSAGLWRSEDDGCNWQGVGPFAKLQSPALAQDPSAPDTLYLATFAPGYGGIRVTHDGGDSWEVSLPTGDDDFIQELSVAPSKPVVVYASGYVFSSANQRMHYVSRSDDGGANWDRFEVSLRQTETDVALLAISPSDPMTLLAGTTDLSPMQRLLISHDGGATFTPAFETEVIRDATFASGGQTIWVAGSKGLWRSADGGQNFAPVLGPLFLSNVIEHDGALWVSGGFAEGQNGIGASIDEGETFEPRMLFKDVSEPIACDEGALTAVMCATPWLDWQREILATTQMTGLRGGFGVDAGTGAETGQASSAGRAARGAAGGAAMQANAGAGERRANGGGGCSVAAPTRSASSLSANVFGMLGASWVWCSRRRRYRDRRHRDCQR